VSRIRTTKLHLVQTFGIFEVSTQVLRKSRQHLRIHNFTFQIFTRLGGNITNEPNNSKLNENESLLKCIMTPSVI